MTTGGLWGSTAFLFRSGGMKKEPSCPGSCQARVPSGGRELPSDRTVVPVARVVHPPHERRAARYCRIYSKRVRLGIWYAPLGGHRGVLVRRTNDFALGFASHGRSVDVRGAETRPASDGRTKNYLWRFTPAANEQRCCLRESH